MTKCQIRLSCGVAAVLAAGVTAALLLRTTPRDLWPILESPHGATAVAIEHPLEGAVMPRNLPAPVLFWKTNLPGIDRWVAGFKAGPKKWSFADIQPGWHPTEPEWVRMKEAAKRAPLEVILAGLRTGRPGEVAARGAVRFTVSEETVESPVFFREVNLPFAEAVKDPSRIRWRFGPLSGPAPPPVVLENMPVCGNCHSFSRNGEYLAMDVDYANSKASYVITRTGKDMRLATSDIITWDDYRREDGQQTFGLLSQISPDGRYVLSTVKDRSVFVPRPDLAFSQLFFPLKGIIAVYDRETREFHSLPGADDPAFVQSNPTWSPDGQTVIFARSRATELEKSPDPGRILLTPEECEEFLKRNKEFRFDLYRVPFHGGQGGKAEPVRGASANGRSNYFPKFSPDGRWIIYCQASNYMLLQPDSDLYVIPAEGGEARRLGCNLSRMNSWHSWSPDGKWLVFSSKAHSDYTQLYLSRIRENGQAEPPVWLAHLVSPGRAANIPEFVALPPDGIVKIREQFLDDYSYTRAGNEFYQAGEVDPAIEKFRLALSLNPNNAMAHQRLGFLLYHAKRQKEEAIKHSQMAVGLEPLNPFARFDLGTALAARGDLTNAVVHLTEAVRLLPDGYDRHYTATGLNFALAEAYYLLGSYRQSIPVLAEVLRRDPRHARANYLMAMARAWLGEADPTVPFYETALRWEPALASLPDFLDLLSRNYTEQGLFAEGFKAAELARQLAVKAGRADQAAKLQQRAEYCRRRL